MVDMLTSFVKSLRNFLLPATDERVAGKRRREESDDAEPGELVKRLRSMTEENMSGGHPGGSRNFQDRAHMRTAPDIDVEAVTSGPSSVVEHRICLPRRPGRRLTDPPQQIPSEVRQVPIVVEETERIVPIVVEDQPTAVEGRRPSSEHPAPAPAPARSLPPAAAAADTAAKPASVCASDGATETAGEDEVVYIGHKTCEKPDNEGVNGGGFEGVRNFQQMVESGRLVGRNSSHTGQPQRQQERSPAQRSVYDKLMGIAPSTKNLKRAVSLAYTQSFRLDEKRRYKQLISRYINDSAGVSTPLTSCRTTSLLTSTPRVALCRDRLGKVATSRLSRRISLVDLVSSGSEGSATPMASRPAPEAATSAGAPPTVVLTGSEADSQAASVDSDDDSVVVEKVLPSPPQRKTALDREIDRRLKQLGELRDKYAASDRDRRRRITEEERRGAISRANHVEWERGLAQRLRRQMRLTQRLALEAEPEVEEEAEEDVLPELTPEMESVISAALRPTPPTELMAEAFNQRLTRHDLQTLKGLNWLNDEVINFYMNMLMERSKTNDSLPKVYCFNTFFYGKIVAQGHSSVRRWTRKVDIFSHDLLMIPVHLGMHWCLACVDLRRKAVRYFDSMHGNNNQGLDAILRYLRDEHADKKKQPLDTADWQAVNEKEIPQQMNGSDCGMFACKFAEYLSRDAPIAFTQEHMPYFRRRLVYEIVTKTLL